MLDDLFSPGFSPRTPTSWKVTQNGAGDLNVKASLGAGAIEYGSTYTYPAWADADVTVAVTTPDVTNPRKDIVVAYIDLAVISANPLNGTQVNNTGALKFKAVPGTAAGSPVDPSDGTIQSSVGAANPWVKCARLAVAANATQILTANITDIRKPLNLRVPVAATIAAITATTVLTWGYDHVSATNAITVTLPDATLNPGGKISLYNGDSNLKTVATTSSQTIAGSTNDYLSNQNDFVEYMSDGTNWVISKERRSKRLAVARVTSNFTTASGSFVQVTGATVNPYVPAGNRKVIIRFRSTERGNVGGGGQTAEYAIYDGVVAVGTLVARQATPAVNSTYTQPIIETEAFTLAAGNAKTYNAAADVAGGLTLTVPGSANQPYLMEAILAD